MPSFQDYSTEDFLQESSFCRYCSGTDPYAVNFWEKWLKDNPDKKQEAKQAREMYYLLNGNIHPAVFQQHRRQFEAAFQQHLRQHTTTVTVPVKGIRKLSFLFRAAIVTGLIALGGYAGWQWLQPPAFVVYSSAAGERRTFRLPDGTRVMLNAGSRLTIPHGFCTSGREVTLSGEAFFDVQVAAGKPFVVHTTGMDIRVLGTVFNVRAYPEDKTAVTTLLRGKVEVLVKAAGKRMVLAPAEKVAIQTAHPAEKPVLTKVTLQQQDSVAQEVLWTRNRLILNDLPLREAALEMERWYGVRITVDNSISGKLRYTATFEKETVEQALQALQQSVPFHYKISDHEIIISQ
ncbi:FecR family protein [Chitinophaga solisilvae]|uniref:FecR family protein n=1 Tax=Chitinophaga solisilvae TaxID=1233460 RepID=UPI0013718162|nr:FecR domain-containing protein [Chitinophaga solisilvae]